MVALWSNLIAILNKDIGASSATINATIKAGNQIKTPKFVYSWGKWDNPIDT